MSNVFNALLNAKESSQLAALISGTATQITLEDGKLYFKLETGSLTITVPMEFQEKAPSE